MNPAMTSIKSFLDQNFYGLILLFIAAFFYKTGEREGATAFFAAGSTLMGIRTPASSPSLKTTQNQDGSTTTAVTNG